MESQLALRHILASRLEKLRTKHPAYSLRAFAKKAGVSPATMSLLIAGKRRASRKVIALLDERLQFDPREKSEVMGLLRKSKKSQDTDPFVQLRMDQYELIGDWKSFALLSLTSIKDFQSDAGWIANRLGITVSEASETIARLKRLGMLIEKNGQLFRADAKYQTTDDIKSTSLLQSHSQTLDLAQSSLERHAVDQRDFSWITFAVDTKKLPLAKTLIRRFQDEFMDLIEGGDTASEVYRLSIQLFPLTRLEGDLT